MLHRGPQEAAHALMEDDYLHIDGVLHLTEQASRFLTRQEPAYLQDGLGPAFADYCADQQVDLLSDAGEMPSAAIVFSLTLVRCHAALQPHEINQLEHFVLKMPEMLYERFQEHAGEGCKVASCCWLQALGGRLPLHWQVGPWWTFHRELACLTG